MRIIRICIASDSVSAPELFVQGADIIIKPLDSMCYVMTRYSKDSHMIMSELDWFPYDPKETVFAPMISAEEAQQRLIELFN